MKTVADRLTTRVCVRKIVLAWRPVSSRGYREAMMWNQCYFDRDPTYFVLHKEVIVPMIRLQPHRRLKINSAVSETL
jgi:hypothetical protein